MPTKPILHTVIAVAPTGHSSVTSITGAFSQLRPLPRCFICLESTSPLFHFGFLLLRVLVIFVVDALVCCFDSSLWTEVFTCVGGNEWVSNNETLFSFEKSNLTSRWSLLRSSPYPMPGKVFGGGGYCRKAKPAPIASKQGQLRRTSSAPEPSIGMAKPPLQRHHSSSSSSLWFCFPHPSSCHLQINLLDFKLWPQISRVYFPGPQSMTTSTQNALL